MKVKRPQESGPTRQTTMNTKNKSSTEYCPRQLAFFGEPLGAAHHHARSDEGECRGKAWSVKCMRPPCCDRPLPSQEHEEVSQQSQDKRREGGAPSTMRATNTDTCIFHVLRVAHRALGCQQ